MTVEVMLHDCAYIFKIFIGWNIIGYENVEWKWNENDIK